MIAYSKICWNSRLFYTHLTSWRMYMGENVLVHTFRASIFWVSFTLSSMQVGFGKGNTCNHT